MKDQDLLYEYGDLTVRAQVGYSDGYGTNNDVTLS